VSREGAGSGQAKDRPAPAAGTPIWVGVLYFLGGLGGVLLGFLVLMRLGRAVWDNVPTYDLSLPLVVFWSALAVFALGTWIWRRQG
jgi:hypothetical protein